MTTLTVDWSGDGVRIMGYDVGAPRLGHIRVGVRNHEINHLDGTVV